MKLGSIFPPNVLDFLYGGNVFGDAMLKKDFLIFNFDECYNNSSFAFVFHFGDNLESIKWIH